MRKYKNRRRPVSPWARVPKPAAIIDACGRALRRSLRGVAVAGALAVVAGGAWAGHRWLTSSPRFAITQITIAGAHRIDPEALRARLPVRVGDNAFADLDAIARVVRGHPWVAAAQVYRVLPHTIAIELREHVAAAAIELGAVHVVDAAGRPFLRAAPGDSDGLPVITGVDSAAYAADPEGAARTVAGAIAAATAWRTEGRPAIAEVHIGAHGAITLHTRAPAIAVQLGAAADASRPPGAPGAPGDAIAARLRTFDLAWAGLSEAERARTRSVHLGARTDHVTVAFARN